jgi:alkylation response protein AidB-like acyl-CoA dehydrogenase
VDFTLTDEQRLLRDTARTLLDKECPVSLVRAHADDREASLPLWRKHLREWVALGDGSLVDHCLFLEECGAVLAPEPYFATSALFLPLMRAAGMDELADAAAAGELTGTVALDEPWSPLTVAAGMVDRVALVLPGPAVAVVSPDVLASREVETLDSTRPVFDVAVEVPVSDLPTVTKPLAADALASVIERAVIALAAELVGTGRWLLDASVTYARERVQFDRPIGSFQGIQHKLVDMALDHERAAAAVYHAAMAFDAGDPERHRAAHVAKATAGLAARHDARDGLQVHGGIGYTWEHDLHLYLRRAYASEALLGTSSWHHDRLADDLFG